MWLVVSAVEMELRGISGVPVGVGPVVSAVHATRVILQKSPDVVVFVGSAGAFVDDLEPGTAIVSRRVGFASGVGVLDLGYVPLPPEELETPTWLQERSGLRAADVVTVPAVSTDPALVDALAARWQVEHMETYAVAAAAHALGVPFVSVLGIANQVGPDAHAQWRANRHRAEEAAARSVRALIGSGAPEQIG